MPRSCPSALRPASSCHGLGGATSAGVHLPTCHLFPSPPLLCSSHSSTCGPPSPTGCHGHETSVCSSAVVSSAWRTRARVKSRRAFSACPSCLSVPGPCGRVWAVGRQEGLRPSKNQARGLSPRVPSRWPWRDTLYPGDGGRVAEHAVQVLLQAAVLLRELLHAPGQAQQDAARLLLPPEAGFLLRRPAGQKPSGGRLGFRTDLMSHGRGEVVQVSVCSPQGS